MNRDCSGDVLLINRRTYYRCLLDSTLIDITEEPNIEGEVCLNCKRKVVGQRKEFLCKTRTIIQYQVVNTDKWYNLEVLVKQPKEDNK